MPGTLYMRSTELCIMTIIMPAPAVCLIQENCLFGAHLSCSGPGLLLSLPPEPWLTQPNVDRQPLQRCPSHHARYFLSASGVALLGSMVPAWAAGRQSGASGAATLECSRGHATGMAS